LAVVGENNKILQDYDALLKLGREKTERIKKKI